VVAASPAGRSKDFFVVGAAATENAKVSEATMAKAIRKKREELRRTKVKCVMSAVVCYLR
jgi:hypothetical protein